MELPPQTATKLRVMCSYGGHIIPLPHSNSLFYTGGDTRIITLPPTSTTTLSSLTSFISSTLNISSSFTLKYQLPNHRLDSLITLSTDEDLFTMLDEYSRLSTARPRMRLFVFCCGESKVMLHPNSDCWFGDALKNVKIGGEGNNAESLVLETTSSFGSTFSSSSSSSSNLTSSAYFQDTLPVASDHSVPTAASRPQMVTYQEKGCAAAVMDKVSGYNPVESESRIADVVTEIEANRTSQLSGFPSSLQYDQSQRVQFVHVGGVPVHYASPYYVVHPPASQQQFYYQANPPQPIYLIPVAQPYSFPVQSGVGNNPAAIASGHPPLHPNTSSSLAQVSYKVASVSPAPESSSQVNGTLHMAQMNHQTKPFVISSAESSDDGNGFDDPLHTQIYKSQPPAPILPSQYETMTNATPIL